MHLSKPAECTRGSRVALVGEIPPASAGDAGDQSSMPGSGRAPGGGSESPLQCSCLGKPVGRGARRAAVHGATEPDATKCTHIRGMYNSKREPACKLSL